MKFKILTLLSIFTLLLSAIGFVLYTNHSQNRKINNCVAIKNTGNAIICLEKEAAKVKSVGEIKSYLKIINTAGGQNLGSGRSELLKECHNAYHVLGKKFVELAQRLPENVNEYSIGCNFGFIHGVLENIDEVTNWELEKLEKESTKFCLQLKGVHDKRDLGNCFHGIGHAISYFTKDLKTGMLYCNQLLPAAPTMEDYEYINQCADGVSMIYFTLQHPGTDFAKGFSDCKIGLDPVLEETCLRGVRSMVDFRDESKYLDFCNSLSGSDKNNCFIGLGSFDASYMHQSDKKNMYLNCVTSDLTSSSECLFQYIRELHYLNVEFDLESALPCSRYTELCAYVKKIDR